MRQPIRVHPKDGDPLFTARTRPTLGAVERGGRPRRTRPPRYWHAGGITDAPAVRAILVVMVVLCAAALVYLLRLAPRPSIGAITPAPSAVAAPGVVEVSAKVTAGGKQLQRVVLSIDGEVVQPAVEVRSPQQWVVRYATVFADGDHRVTLQAFDIDGKSQQHQWSFTASGPRITPSLAFSDPPQGTTLAPGPVLLSAQATVAGDLTVSAVLLDGKPIPSAATPIVDQNGSNHRPKTWIISATPQLATGTHTVRITVEDKQHGDLQVEQRVTVAASEAKATTLYFPDTKRYLSGPFKTFWDSHDHALLFGDPISPEMVDKTGKTVQYFQRARFELGPGGAVSLGLIGKESLPAPVEGVDDPNKPDVLYFPETHHTVAGKFRQFWEQHGGLAIFGYPISEESDEAGVRVQYFERARLDLQPSASGGAMTVHLADLGQQRWAAVSAGR